MAKMMRMVSNVKVGPHANDIKEDQRDENGGTLLTRISVMTLE